MLSAGRSPKSKFCKAKSPQAESRRAFAQDDINEKARGESSHSPLAMVGERLGAPAIKFVNSTSGRSKPLPYGQAQGARIFKSKGFEYLSHFIGINLKI
jgi:hypothetical protein